MCFFFARTWARSCDLLSFFLPLSTTEGNHFSQFFQNKSTAYYNIMFLVQFKCMPEDARKALGSVLPRHPLFVCRHVDCEACKDSAVSGPKRSASLLCQIL